MTPPTISNGQPSGTHPAGTSSTNISVTTNEAATCRWGTSSTASYAALPTAFTTTGSTIHSTAVTGLAAGQSYTYYVRCQDAVGNANGTAFVIGFNVVGFLVHLLVIAGLIFMGFGLAFGYATLGYEIGSAFRMGPGYFPLVLSAIMASAEYRK